MGKSQKQVADDFNKSNRKKLEIPRLESASGQGSGAHSNNEPANKSLGHVVRRLDGALEQLPGVKLSLTADRPFTYFTSNGFTPEISQNFGWDEGVYPLAATYTFGLTIDF